MKINFLKLCSLLLILPALAMGQKKPMTGDAKDIMAAKQVLMRVIGMKSEAFTFEKIPAANGLDVFEVNASKGKVTIKGSSTIAMTRGAYEYLRTACNIQYTWSTDRITPPTNLPDLVIPRTVSPYKFRQYYNVCAYGYTTAFWKWEDWQKELDWMALHGINMPVAMAGQEAIWQKVYKEMGMTDQEIAAFFNGPAFLPWQRMGNVNSHDGPLPQSYIDASAVLQKQLIERMMQLGMDPIVPAFSGFVPKAYKRLYPEAKLLDVKGWCNFPDTNQAYILPPGSSDFVNIGRRFIQEYQTAYGKVHYYLADLFNENEVPVSEANRYTELAGFGKSVYDAINSADPQGIWVMQGWLFFNDEKFWDKESVKAFLSQVPNDRMVIIDLANESFHGWEKLDGFFGKQWIYSTIHNYGGNSQMIGNLPLYATDAPNMLTNPKRGNITGFGLSPEGVLNNEVVYELLTDVAWSSKPIDIKAWLNTYVKQRYGKEDEKLFYAWTGLLESIYSVPNAFISNVYQSRPGMNPRSNIVTGPAFDQAVASFLNNAEGYMTNPRFKHDLVQLVVQYAGNKTDGLIRSALQLYKEGDTAQARQIFGKVKELMLMMDAMTYTLPEQRLETWIDNARKWGKTKEESDYYEADAKRQVTVWINSSNPTLFEYASKVWSGLIRDYYMPRWQLYADGLSSGKPADLKTWEETWIQKPGLRSKAPITGDLLTYARLLYNTAGEYSVSYCLPTAIKPAYSGENKAEINFSALLDSPEQLFSPVADPSKAKEKGSKAKKSADKSSVPATRKTVEIFYTTDGSTPGMASMKAEGPVKVTLPATVKAAAFFDKKAFGAVSTLNLPVSYGKSVVLSPMPSEKYIAKGNQSVTDAIYGSLNYKDGKWLGFEGDNMNATIDLGESFSISSVTVNYLENSNACILGPLAISVLTSVDGTKYTTVSNLDLDTHSWSYGSSVKKAIVSFAEANARYVKITVNNQGISPEGTPCAGKKAWMFIDEISVK